MDHLLRFVKFILQTCHFPFYLVSRVACRWQMKILLKKLFCLKVFSKRIYKFHLYNPFKSLGIHRPFADDIDDDQYETVQKVQSDLVSVQSDCLGKDFRQIKLFWFKEIVFRILIFPKRQILVPSKLKEFAGDSFKFDENGGKFSKNGRKLFGKRTNYSLWAISPFLTMFPKDFYSRHVNTRACLEKG